MNLFIVKIGGNVIDDPAQLASFLRDFSRVRAHKILVHGGGKIATEMSGQLGIESKMVDGRRITDAETLKVVQMVYGGLINKNVVAALQSKKCNAVGLTGADAGIVLANKRPVVPVSGSDKGIDYGFVGDVKKVNAGSLAALLKSGFTPVIAPLTHNGKGQMLNTNADTMASAIAVSLASRFKVSLVYCFEKSGVLRDVEDESSVLSKINTSEYRQLKKEGVIFKGMIPKLDNAFEALRKGVHRVSISHARDLLRITSGKEAGTLLLK